MAAREAARNGGPLPGYDPMARLHDLDIPFATHLDLLSIATEQASRKGIFTAKVPGVRALWVTDLYGCGTQGWSDNEFTERLGRKADSVRRRAGIAADPGLNVNATSLDSVSRDPQRVPFAAYPLHPVACARLIGDLAVFTVETSGPALADSLRSAGFDTRWVRPPGGDELVPGEVVMEIRATLTGPAYRRVLTDVDRTFQVRRSALDRYLIEMVEQGTWADGLRELPRVFRTGNLRLIHAASCPFRYPSRTSCGVL
jgi:hypothetical protein